MSRAAEEAERQRLLTRVAVRRDNRKRKALTAYRKKVSEIDADYTKERLAIYEAKPPTRKR
jgi:hypothetical protein